MKRVPILAALGLAAAAFAQSPDFKRPPPAWQIALSAGEGSEPPTQAAACAGCHGANGMPAAGTPFPRLAGLPVEYLAKQLFDYRDSTRPSPVMGPLANGLSDAEIASLARHYAAQPVPAREDTGTDAAQRGRQLARYGDNTLAIPACVDCHGSDATGGGPILPPLAQPTPYTAAQLQAFRSGERGNDDNRVMREFAMRLSDEDIQALADYYSGS
jgi:cytochrome c553